MEPNKNINSSFPSLLGTQDVEKYEQDQKVIALSQVNQLKYSLYTQVTQPKSLERLRLSQLRRIILCHFILHSKLKRILRRSLPNHLETPQGHRKIRGTLKPMTRLNENWSRMYHKIKELDSKVSEEARQKLRFFLIQYLAKVGSCSTPETYLTRYLTSPLQQNEFGYFRSSTNLFLNVLEEQISKELNIPLNPSTLTKVLVLSNSQAVFDDLEKRQELCILNFNDDEVEIVRKLKAFEQHGHLSPLRFIAYHLPSFNDPSFPNSAELVNHFLQKVTDIANQLSISAPILSFGEKEGSHFLMIQTYMTAYERNTAPNDFSVRHSYIETEIKQLREYNGYAPTLQQTARILSTKNIPLEDLFKRFDLKIEPMLAEKGSKDSNAIVFIPKMIPLISKNPMLGGNFVPIFEKFVSSPTFLTFSKCLASEDLPFAVKLLCSNIVKYIEGFKEFPLDESFKKMGLQQFLEESYVRVLNYMEVVMTIGYDPIQYSQNKLGSVTLSNYQNLIFEELLFWTDICRDDKSTDESLNKILNHSVLAAAELRPSLTVMMNTGVRCATLIRKACQSISPKFNIICFNDSYYEIGLATNSALRNSVAMVDSPFAMDILKSQLKEFERENKKLDLVYVDPHGSLNVNVPTISSQNIEGIIESIFESNMAQTPLTIAMDITIGKINDNAFSNLVNKFKNKIEAGALNLVFYRTIQKFDSFGTDKISGGYIQVYSQHKEFIDSLQSISPLEGGDVDAINKKALVHFYENCLEGLDQYRQKSFDNARYVYDRIKKDYIYPSAQCYHLPFFISEVDDQENFFITINVNYSSTIVDQLINEIVEFGAMSRPSFGYSHFTYVQIPRGNKISYRICFGLEEKERLDIFLNVLNAKLEIFDKFNKEYYDRMLLELTKDGTCDGIDKNLLNEFCNTYLGKYLQNTEGLNIEEYVNQVFAPFLLNHFLVNNQDDQFFSLLQKFKNKGILNPLIPRQASPFLKNLIQTKFEEFTINEYKDYFSTYHIHPSDICISNLTSKLINECYKEYHDKIYTALTQDGSCDGIDTLFLEDFCRRELGKYFENNQGLSVDDYINLISAPLLLDVLLNCQIYSAFLSVLDKKFIKKGTLHLLIEPWTPPVLKSLVYKELIDLTTHELSEFFINTSLSEMTLPNFKSKFIFELLFKRLKAEVIQYGPNVIESITKEIDGFQKQLSEAHEAWIKKTASTSN